MTVCGGLAKRSCETPNSAVPLVLEVWVVPVKTSVVEDVLLTGADPPTQFPGVPHSALVPEPVQV